MFLVNCRSVSDPSPVRQGAECPAWPALRIWQGMTVRQFCYFDLDLVVQVLHVPLVGGWGGGSFSGGCYRLG